MNQVTTVDHVVEAVRELSRERPVVIAQDIALEFDIDYASASIFDAACVKPNRGAPSSRWTYCAMTPADRVHIYGLTTQGT